MRSRLVVYYLHKFFANFNRLHNIFISYMMTIDSAAHKQIFADLIILILF